MTVTRRKAKISPALQAFIAGCRSFANALSDEVLILDTEFKVAFANQALLQNRGWTANEVVGKHCYEVSHQRTSPCYPEEVCPLLQTLASASAARTTHMHKDKRGNISYVDIVTSPIKEPDGKIVGVIEMMRDVTKMVEMEKALTQRNEDLATLNALIMMGSKAESEEQILRNALRTILQNTGMDVGWILLREDDSTAGEGTNTHPAQPIKLRCVEAVGVSQRFIDTICSLPSDQTLCGLAALKGQTSIIENFSDDPRVTDPTLRAEGLRGFMCAPLRSDTKLLGSISVAGRAPTTPPATRLQQLVTIGDELGMIISNLRLRRSLQQYVTELEEARRRRDEFASAISHELKHVLSVLSGYAQLLNRWRQARWPDDEITRIIETIDRQSRRLNRLIDDMRDVSALEAGRFAIAPRECDLVAVAREVADVWQPLSNIHRLIIQTAEARIEGRWDCDRIRQVLDNLVDNAIKYSPRGGEVRIALRREGSEVLIAVSDQGVGISRAELPHLFQPYARAHKEIKGLGLGLFICKGIVEAHGGRIWVESEEGKGSTFYIKLPTGHVA